MQKIKKTKNQSVYENECLLKSLTFLSQNTIGRLLPYKERGSSASPVAVGLIFLWLPLVFAAFGLSDRIAHRSVEGYMTYFDNISWAISLTYLFPLVVALTLWYYQEIPRLFNKLFKNLAVPAGDKEVEAREPGQAKINTETYTAEIIGRFNGNLSAWVIMGLALLYNAIHYWQIVTNEYNNWIVAGSIYLPHIGTIINNLSWLGLASFLVKTILAYFIGMFLWKSVILAQSLTMFFKDIKTHITPLHEDGRFGLKCLGDISIMLSTILFPLGIFMVLKIVDKIVIQKSSLLGDIGNPTVITAFAIAAPLLFFFPLTLAHRLMKEAKAEFIARTPGTYNAIRSNIEKANEETFKELAEAEAIRREYQKNIPVWPFNIKSFVATGFSSVIIPLGSLIASLISMIKGS